MKPLKGYGREPGVFVAYWPTLDDRGEMVEIVAASHTGFQRVYKSWVHVLDEARAVAPKHSDDWAAHSWWGPKAWWIGPDAGHIGNVFALRQLMGNWHVGHGLFSEGQGLWTLDVHGLKITKEPHESPILCLRDAGKFLGTDLEFENERGENSWRRVMALYAQIMDCASAMRRADLPISITPASSGASYVRHEYVPGGRGYARRALSRHARAAAAHVPPEEAGFSQIEKVPDWVSMTPHPWTSKPSAHRKRGGRFEGDPTGDVAWEWTAANDAYAEPAYYGGRVERWADKVVRGKLYDIRSAYAFAMALPLPTRFRVMGAGEGNIPDDGFTICRARVVVPESCKVPPLPYRLNGGMYDRQVFFPWGAWEGTYCLEELQYARHLGATVDIGRWWHWEAEEWLAPYVRTWWNRREEARESGDTATETLAKHMLNGLYGKLAQGDGFEYVTTAESEYAAAAERGLNPRRLLIPCDGGVTRPLYIVPRNTVASFRHTACAAAIAARTRINLGLAMNGLFNALSPVKDATRILFVNTDGIATNGYLPCGVDLGDWRAESAFDVGEALADRCVAMKRGEQWDIRAAGLSIKRVEGETDASYNRRINRAWDELVTKGRTESQIVRGVRSGIKLGSIRYRVESVSYDVHSGNIPKRVDDGRGGTVAWSLPELRKRAGSRA